MKSLLQTVKSILQTMKSMLLTIKSMLQTMKSMLPVVAPGCAAALCDTMVARDLGRNACHC